MTPETQYPPMPRGDGLMRTAHDALKMLNEIHEQRHRQAEKLAAQTAALRHEQDALTAENEALLQAIESLATWHDETAKAADHAPVYAVGLTN